MRLLQANRVGASSDESGGLQVFFELGDGAADARWALPEPLGCGPKRSGSWAKGKIDSHDRPARPTSGIGGAGGRGTEAPSERKK